MTVQPFHRNPIPREDDTAYLDPTAAADAYQASSDYRADLDAWAIDHISRTGCAAFLVFVKLMGGCDVAFRLSDEYGTAVNDVFTGARVLS